MHDDDARRIGSLHMFDAGRQEGVVEEEHIGQSRRVSRQEIRIPARQRNRDGIGRRSAEALLYQSGAGEETIENGNHSAPSDSRVEDDEEPADLYRSPDANRIEDIHFWKQTNERPPAERGRRRRNIMDPKSI